MKRPEAIESNKNQRRIDYIAYATSGWSDDMGQPIRGLKPKSEVDNRYIAVQEEEQLSDEVKQLEG
jgi:hypothetical protein